MLLFTMQKLDERETEKKESERERERRHLFEKGPFEYSSVWKKNALEKEGWLERFLNSPFSPPPILL